MGLAGPTFSLWVAGVQAEAVAVTWTVPAAVPTAQKLAALVPAASETVEAGMVQPAAG